jgi:hypothetical protein
LTGAQDDGLHGLNGTPGNRTGRRATLVKMQVDTDRGSGWQRAVEPM